MAYENVQITCKNCGSKFITGMYDGKLDEDTCDCGEKYEVTPWKDITDPPLILTAAENELENANWHNVISLPGAVYRSVSPLVLEDKRADVARAIAIAFIDGIR
jgi:hypothetical protein